MQETWLIIHVVIKCVVFCVVMWCDQSLIDRQFNFVWCDQYMSSFTACDSQALQTSWLGWTSHFPWCQTVPCLILSKRNSKQTCKETNCSKHFSKHLLSQPIFLDMRFWSCWLAVGFERDYWRPLPSALTCWMCTCGARVSSCKHWSSGVPLLQIVFWEHGNYIFFHWF